MKNVLIFNVLLTLLTPNFIYSDYYDQQAAADVAREEAAEKRARIEARANELRRRDFEAIVGLITVAGKFIAVTATGSYKVIRHPDQITEGWRNGDGEIIWGSLVVGSTILGTAIYLIDKAVSN